nr:hypothetical protein KitaXyl93_24100 [Kitasatospora sp. Xyl93]
MPSSRYFPGSRTTAVTVCPRRTASATAARPTRPPAPKITILLMVPPSTARSGLMHEDGKREVPGYFNGTGPIVEP